ncbi:hypothetical protein FXF75_21880 [Halorussus sp. MSC15.2]|nr:hypothetical protein [Halorussus sp. MSC15.2]
MQPAHTPRDVGFEKLFIFFRTLFTTFRYLRVSSRVSSLARPCLEPAEPDGSVGNLDGVVYQQFVTAVVVLAPPRDYFVGKTVSVHRLSVERYCSPINFAE